MEDRPIPDSSPREGWIQMIGAREADGALKEVYLKMRANMSSRPGAYSPPNGDAPNIVKSHSLDPEGLRLAFSLSTALHWSDKSLLWAKREMINTVTSRANDCFYWVSAHAEFLRVASKDADLAARLKSNFRQAALSERDRRMLEFVEKLTLYPWLMVQSDVETLREAGFPDSTILHIVLGCAHFNYLNRMADGIGIHFEYQTEVPEPSSFHSTRKLTQAMAPPLRELKSASTRAAWIAFPASEGVTQDFEPLRNLYRLISYNAEALTLTREWRAYQLNGSKSLNDRLRSQLALYISGLNNCDYSCYWFKKRLEDLGEPYACSEVLASGELPQDLSARERVLFAHARRLTQEPANTREEHINELRSAGLDDHGILQLTMLCSYLSFENRAVLGLGVAIESDAETSSQ